MSRGSAMGFQEINDSRGGGFPVHVHGRNFLITPAIKAHVEEKLRHLGRLHTSVLHVDVTLELLEKEHVCVVVLHTDRMHIQAQSRSADVYLAITLAERKIIKQVERWKSRLQDYHKKSLGESELEILNLHPLEDLEGEVFNKGEQEPSMEETWQPGKIVSRERLSMKTLTVEEAVMQMDLTSAPFLLFRDEVDQSIKVIYPRQPGQYSLIIVQ